MWVHANVHRRGADAAMDNLAEAGFADRVLDLCEQWSSDQPFELDPMMPLEVGTGVSGCGRIPTGHIPRQVKHHSARWPTVANSMVFCTSTNAPPALAAASA